MQTPGTLIEAIHQAPLMLALEFAGAGAQALAWLHSVGGSSRTILEATDRYSSASLVELIGFEPEQFVSGRVAEVMAIKAYLRADHLAPPGIPIVGIGCTATIATNRLKRGEHSAHVAAYDGKQVREYGLALAKGRRTRQEEEQLISLLIIQAIAESCELEMLAALPLTAEERVEKQVEVKDLLDQVMEGSIPWVLAASDGQMSAGKLPQPLALLSGSFNPLHEGHRQMAEVAARMLGCQVYFELPVVNADKAPIKPEEARRRLAQFTGFAPVILTRTPLFSQKARFFPGATFILGMDTAERLIQPRFYENDPIKMLASFEQIRLAGCRFLVAGRLKEGRFLTLSDLPLPAGYRELFIEIPEAAFRVDVSSTALREIGPTT